MTSPFTTDIRPRRLPVEIRQIEEASKEHGMNNASYFCEIISINK